ncbi:MAG: hypothetical protein OEV85_00100 [Candidatus Thorarchaeota archaeon]|nr:hypothetical protein [Candidatus Thorarchaeota archaeon]
MSSKKSGRVALAIGVWLVLSVVVFGSLIYVACTSNCVEIIASEDGISVDMGNVDQVPATDQRIRRGPIEMVPFYYPGFWRGPIFITPT